MSDEQQHPTVTAGKTVMAFIEARLNEWEGGALQAIAEAPAPWVSIDYGSLAPERYAIVRDAEGSEISCSLDDYPGPIDTRGTFAPSVAAHVADHDPGRVLAQVAALRAVLGEHQDCSIVGVVLVPCPTVRHLAAIWADHPDYRQEWKP